MRKPPTETDRYHYDLDAIQMGHRGGTGPTLRQILIRACMHGADEGIHEDPDRADEFASTCALYEPLVRASRTVTLSVREARKLYDATLSAWEYADQNNYGADDEDIEEDRIFGKHGEFVLHALTWPWSSLVLSDDGNHGFTRVGKKDKA